MMDLKESIIKSLGLVEIEKGVTVRKGQTFYSFDFYEGMGEPYESRSSVLVERDTAIEDFKVAIDGFYRESINIDDLNPGSLVSSSGEPYFIINIFGVKYFASFNNRIYREIEIDEVIYYA